LRDSSPASAAAVALHRRAIRRDFLEWSRHCGFEPAAHHRLLIEKLTAVAERRISNLAVFMPPGSAKSTYASILFVAWFLARFADKSIIAASHTTELAEKWGRRIRNLISEHGPTLGIELAADSQAAGRWALKSGGAYHAAGVGSAIVGFRADGAIIDDPVRSREDADSKIIRDKTWEWYQSDLTTRLKPGGFKVLIQTRWHEDDLAGRILTEADRTGEQWEVISLPAEARENDPLGRQPGEMLWADDDVYGYARLLAHEKNSQPPRNWAALYQQNPVPDAGNYFEEQWLRPYSQMPPKENLHIYGASDFAVTQDGGDWTVHIIVGVDQNNKMYLLDLWRKRTSTDQWIDAWCDLVRKWKPLDWGFEGGQIKSSVGPFLERRARERKAYCSHKTFPSKHDKSVRAQSIRGRMAMEGLYVPVHAHWYPDFLSEVLSFPAGKHDDQVDCLSLIGQMLTRITRGRVPETKAKLKVLTVGNPDTQEAISLTELFEINETRVQRHERI
jgi:predicted phage terminase large subunit-like protein